MRAASQGAIRSRRQAGEVEEPWDDSAEAAAERHLCVFVLIGVGII